MKKIIVFLLCLTFYQVNAQKNTLESDGLVVYPFNINSTDPRELSYLDTIIKPYNIFGLAEYHWNETTLKESKKFITYLALTKGLDKIVIERPYAYGYWINEYLASGDTVLLKTITDKFWTFDYYREKTTRYVNYYEFYKWLFSFKNRNNLSLEVIGIDLDQLRNGSLELWSIKYFIDKHSVISIFPLSYPILNEYCEREPKLSELKKINRIINEEMASSNELLIHVLASDYQVFTELLSSVDDILSYRKKPSNSTFREDRMAERFIEEIDSSDIVYAQFGHVHILRSSGTRHKALKGFDGGFISRVESNPKFTSKVLSIYILCKGCKGRGLKTYHPGFFGQTDYDKIYNAIGGKSVLIDFRKAKNEFSDIPKSFQLSIFLHGTNSN